MSPFKQQQLLKHLLYEQVLLEQELEKFRADLCLLPTFDSYSAFQRIISGKSVESIENSDIQLFLQECRYNQPIEGCTLFIQKHSNNLESLTFLEFVECVLPYIDERLREETAQRVPPSNKKSAISIEAEIKLSELINYEIAYLLRLDRLKYILETNAEPFQKDQQTQLFNSVDAKQLGFIDTDAIKYFMIKNGCVLTLLQLDLLMNCLSQTNKLISSNNQDHYPIVQMPKVLQINFNSYIACQYPELNDAKDIRSRPLPFTCYYPIEEDYSSFYLKRPYLSGQGTLYKLSDTNWNTLKGETKSNKNQSTYSNNLAKKTPFIPYSSHQKYNQKSSNFDYLTSTSTSVNFTQESKHFKKQNNYKSKENYQSTQSHPQKQQKQQDKNLDLVDYYIGEEDSEQNKQQEDEQQQRQKELQQDEEQPEEEVVEEEEQQEGEKEIIQEDEEDKQQDNINRSEEQQEQVDQDQNLKQIDLREGQDIEELEEKENNNQKIREKINRHQNKQQIATSAIGKFLKTLSKVAIEEKKAEKAKLQFLGVIDFSAGNLFDLAVRSRGINDSLTPQEFRMWIQYDLDFKSFSEQECQVIFRTIDISNSGLIKRKEFTSFLSPADPHIATKRQFTDIQELTTSEKKELREFFQATIVTVDKFSQLKDIYCKPSAFNNKIPSLFQLFSEIDKDNDGYLSKYEIQMILEESEIKLDDITFYFFMRRLNRNKNISLSALNRSTVSKISFGDFMRALSS